jgi:hypothetical protein
MATAITISGILYITISYTILVFFRLIQSSLAKNFFKKYIFLEPIIFVTFVVWLGHFNDFLVEYFDISKGQHMLIFSFLYLIIPMLYISLKRLLLISAKNKIFASWWYIFLEFLWYLIAFSVAFAIEASLSIL